MFAIRFESFTQMFLYVFIAYFIHMFFICPYKDSSTRYKKFCELYTQVLEKEIENHKNLHSRILFRVFIIYLFAFYHTCKIILLSNVSEVKKEFVKSYLSPIKLKNDVYLQPCYYENTTYYIPIKFSSNANSIDIISVNIDYRSADVKNISNVEKYIRNIVTKNSMPVCLTNISPNDIGAEYLTVNYLSNDGIQIKTFGSSDEIIVN